MPMELKLIEGRGVLQQLRSGGWRQFLFEMAHTLAKGQIQEQLDKADQVTAPATPVAVEQVLMDIHIEGRTGLSMERTQPDQLRQRAGTTRFPIVPLQILQQRDALF